MIGYFWNVAASKTEPLVVLGVSGGIACYKAVELVRLLVKAELKVRVIMTRGAMEFVTPLSFQTLSGHPVATNTFDLTQESEIGHINLADEANLVVIAPATAKIPTKRMNRPSLPKWKHKDQHYTATASRNCGRWRFHR